MTNYLTNFSDAAQTYVVSRTGDDCTRSKWDTARQAFDAGFAKRLDTPEPELIEYADPRRRNGARVRGVFASDRRFALEGVVYEKDIAFVDGDQYAWSDFAAVYLLAEAPNPDAEVLEALMRADCFREELPVYADRLSFMRNAGLKVELAS